jgi:hypothetical protein
MIVTALIATSPLVSTASAAAQLEGGVSASEALQVLAQNTRAGRLSAAHDVTDALRAHCVSGVKLQQTMIGIDALDRLITQRDASTLVAFAGTPNVRFVRDAKSPFCTEGNVQQQAPSVQAAPPPPPPPPPPPD